MNEELEGTLVGGNLKSLSTLCRHFLEETTEILKDYSA